MARRWKEKKNWRLAFIFWLLIFAFVGVSGRLVKLQVIDNEKYQALAQQQRIKTIEIPPRRGIMYDREMEELAVSIALDSVYAVPHEIKDKPQSARLLSGVLGESPESIEQKLNRDSNFVYVARKVESDISERIADLDLKGIYTVEESKRCYPYKSLAAQLIGFAGMDNTGLTGLELYYDKILKGEPGKLVSEQDPRGLHIPGGFYYLDPSTDGNDIILTIDKDIQFKTEECLRKAVESNGAKRGTIIAMDPKSGAILAMANYPTFDPNDVSNASQETIRNRAVTDLYEPGSTMKIVTGCAVLEEGLVEPSTVFHLPSKLKIADRVISDSHERGAIDLTVEDIIVKSSNIGVVKLGLLLGKERLYSYIDRFDLTKCSGIDFPGEVKGLCPAPKQWSGSTIGNIPFGQGISVTALQSLRAMSVVANEGKLVQPYLMQEVRSRDGKALGAALTESPKEVISKETAEQMKSILANVVKRGTGENAALSEYGVAGKTGTAQKPRKDGQGYEEGKYIASFIGFAPVDNPQIAIVVIIDEPRTSIWGSTAAAPTFKEVAEFSLRHLKVPPHFMSTD